MTHRPDTGTLQASSQGASSLEARSIEAGPLNAADFAPFGDVIATDGAPDMIINDGRCGRFHDRARLDHDDEGRLGISLFRSEPVSLPIAIDLLERHPDGSQAFLPMSETPYLVVVAADDGGRPGEPLAFIAAATQGVNYHRNVWHAVLMPLDQAGLFGVVDRIGTGPNLEVFELNPSINVTCKGTGNSTGQVVGA